MRGLIGTPPGFLEALGLNLVWMNVSEVFRYFVVVKPLVRSDFAFVPGITPDTPLIAMLWAVWDAVLILVTTTICWTALCQWKDGWRSAVAAGTLVWASVFVLLWLGLHNMGLARPHTIAAALPLAWIELVVAALLVDWRWRRHAGTSLVDAAAPACKPTLDGCGTHLAKTTKWTSRSQRC